MLSVFPSLFSYALAVPLAFRLVAGITFLVVGYKIITAHAEETKAILEKISLKPTSVWFWALSAIEMISAILLIIGLYTQVAALVAIMLLMLTLIAKKKVPNAIPFSYATLSLLLLVVASLLLLGPGFYSVDWPL